MKRLTISILILTLVKICLSQSIQNVDFDFRDEKIFINYDLVDCGNDIKYTVEIKFTDDKGTIIVPKSLSGDYGLVSCGIKKQAIWNIFKDVDNLDGNFMAIVTIVKPTENLAKSTNKSVSNNMTKIIKIDTAGKHIEAVIKKGKKEKIKIGDIIYVLHDGILSRSGDVIKKIGKIEIFETEYDISKGVFYINNDLDGQMIEKHISDLSLQKFKRFDFSIYTTFGYFVQQTSYLGIGANVNYYFTNNKLILGLDLGAITMDNFVDCKVNFGVTPYFLNSKHFSFGLEYQPFHCFDSRDGEYGLYDGDAFNYGSRYGVYGSFIYNRIKVNPSICALHYIKKNEYYEYEEEGTNGYIALTVKYRLK